MTQKTTLRARDILCDEIASTLRTPPNDTVKYWIEKLTESHYITREMAADIANLVFAVSHSVRYPDVTAEAVLECESKAAMYSITRLPHKIGYLGDVNGPGCDPDVAG